MKNQVYRDDIDGLRALAVLSVVVFHLGYLPNGYLGVDIFFVISGFLITGIIYRESQEGKFSIRRFYERRIRRILPQVIFVEIVILIIGLIFMLPDDLENMCQSIVATNFFSNNILLSITTGNYWAITNDYKPLMHTWSLGVEEQFYFIFPFIFVLFKGRKRPLAILSCLTIISIILFFSAESVVSRFYFLQYRFFEMSLGGLCAILLNKRTNSGTHEIGSRYSLLPLILLLLLIILISVDFEINRQITLLMSVVLTASVLYLGDSFETSNKLYFWITQNKYVCFVGRISFSIYMWHQVVFAFYRYLYAHEFTLISMALLIILVFALSTLTYYIVEVPFRNRMKMSVKKLVILIAPLYVCITLISLSVYLKGGVIRDVPSLGIVKQPFSIETMNFFSSRDNYNISYNENIRNKYDVSFEDTTKLNIFVIGNSFARDFSNVILESIYANDVEISYKDDVYTYNEAVFDRFKCADIIFFASGFFTVDSYNKLVDMYHIKGKEYYVVGTKQFGDNNGWYYFKELIGDCDYGQRAVVPKKRLILNEQQKTLWKDRYVDLLALDIDNNKAVRIYTPSKMFISQDTKHFTKYGAIYYSKLLKQLFGKIFNDSEKKRND